jgi:hypothetical protein
MTQPRSTKGISATVLADIARLFLLIYKNLTAIQAFSTITLLNCCGIGVSKGSIIQAVLLLDTAMHN